VTALVSAAVIASSLAACDSDTPEAADSSDASTSTQLKGTAVQDAPTPLEVLMESGAPAGIDYRYTAEHVWAKKLADGTVEFGLSNFAQEALGDIVFLEFPQVGSTCAPGAPCGLVESTKTVTEIYLPFKGTVMETNTGLTENPERINGDPYGSWLIRLSPDDPAAFDSLGREPT
jgi:glycine cleavage system H protein